MTFRAGKPQEQLLQAITERAAVSRNQGADLDRRFCETGELPPIEWECCPNCGHKLGARSEKGIRRALAILNKWIEDGRPEANKS